MPKQFERSVSSCDISRYHFCQSRDTFSKDVRIALPFQGAHSDYGSLTLLFQHENQAGLEVLNRSANTWHSVEARNDLIVVNFGDAFEYWSKGLIKSTVHRVCLPSGQVPNEDRFSVAYFCDPNGETPLTPIPSKLIIDRVYEKDQHAVNAFDPRDNSEKVLTAGEHLLMRLNKTHKY